MESTNHTENAELQKEIGSYNIEDTEKQLTKISVEDAKKILEAEEQKKQQIVESVKNEIEEILQKNNLTIVSIIDKNKSVEIINEFLQKPDTNYFIIYPELRFSEQQTL